MTGRCCRNVRECVFSNTLVFLTPAQNFSAIEREGGGGGGYTPLEHDYIICHDVKRDTLSCLKNKEKE